MEYPSNNDFFLTFKAIRNSNGYFDDYILVSASSNFPQVTNIRPEFIMGQKISHIISEYPEELFGIKEIYYNMIPKTRRKFQRYFKEINRWYLITIFSDDRESLLLFYNDITTIKSSKNLSNFSNKEVGICSLIDALASVK